MPLDEYRDTNSEGHSASSKRACRSRGKRRATNMGLGAVAPFAEADVVVEALSDTLFHLLRSVFNLGSVNIDTLQEKVVHVMTVKTDTVEQWIAMYSECAEQDRLLAEADMDTCLEALKAEEERLNGT